MDHRYDALGAMRSAAAMVMHPVQTALAWPFERLGGIFDFFSRHQELINENNHLRQEFERLSADLQAMQSLRHENAELRDLLDLAQPAGRQPLTAAIIAAPVDPLTRRLVINRGSQAGVSAGLPVVDARGLLGQITRVHPFSSELTLVVSRRQMVPVESERTGQRLLTRGVGSDSLIEIPYLDQHSDLLAGDVLVTSGLDGVFPRGIPVARVLQVRPPQGASPFSRAQCAPIAGSGLNRPVRVLLPLTALQPVAPPSPEEP
jgi:rod shape-determining protein MreC